MALWDRLRNEDENAWLAFKAYRDQLAPRKRFRPGWPVADVQRWSNEHFWSDRVRAWDEHLDAVHQLEMIGAVKEEARKRGHQWALLAKTGCELVIRELGKLLRMSHAQEEAPLYQINVSQLAKIADLSFKMDRLLADQATEIVESVRHDLSAFTPEELVTWRKLIAKSQPGPNALPALTAFLSAPVGDGTSGSTPEK